VDNLAESFTATLLAVTDLDAFELCMLLAFGLAVVAGILRAIARSVDGALVAFALSVVAMGFLVD